MSDQSCPNCGDVLGTNLGCHECCVFGESGTRPDPSVALPRLMSPQEAFDEAFCERAAIMEYDAGLPRAVAEFRALRCLRLEFKGPVDYSEYPALLF